MLAGQVFGLSCLWPGKYKCSKFKPNTQLALSRLNGFAFIGLTEEWSLSICLLHVMYGGECLAVEFMNTRPSSGARASPTIGSSWGGATDTADLAVYAEASARFWKKVNELGVSRRYCRAKVCPGAPAGAFE